jgi:methyl-accepting chemotaxis protein
VTPHTPRHAPLSGSQLSEAYGDSTSRSRQDRHERHLAQFVTNNESEPKRMWSVFKSAVARPRKGPTSPSAPTAQEQGVLTIWARQIENARQQTESAVTDLSLRFGDIVQKMDMSISRSQQESETHASEAAQDGHQAEKYLSQVITALREIQHSRDVLTTEISAIVAFTSELQKMAEDVKMIAFQTNMLSLNAAIEAAHAGEAGKGFAVVAHEVQMLSKASRDTGQNINQRIESITGALKKIDEHNKSVNGYDAEAIRTSEDSIRTVLDRQRERADQFAAAAHAARTENNTIKNDVEDALVKLQFQDRVSQILAQIVGAMEQADAPMDATAPRNATVVDLEARRLEQMASSYTTDEQRRIHAGLEAEAVTPGEATFF